MINYGLHVFDSVLMISSSAGLFRHLSAIRSELDLETDSFRLILMFEFHAPCRRTQSNPRSVWDNMNEASAMETRLSLNEIVALNLWKLRCHVVSA